MKKIDENACFVIRCVNGEERILIPAVYANNGHRACIVVAHLTPLSLLTHPTRRPSSSSTIQQQVLLVSRPSRIPLPPPMRASFDRHRHAFILNHPPPPFPTTQPLLQARQGGPPRPRRQVRHRRAGQSYMLHHAYMHMHPSDDDDDACLEALRKEMNQHTSTGQSKTGPAPGRARPPARAGRHDGPPHRPQRLHRREEHRRRRRHGGSLGDEECVWECGVLIVWFGAFDATLSRCCVWPTNSLFNTPQSIAPPLYFRFAWPMGATSSACSRPPTRSPSSKRPVLG